jgi:hypothetical protein
VLPQIHIGSARGSVHREAHVVLASLELQSLELLACQAQGLGVVPVGIAHSAAPIGGAWRRLHTTGASIGLGASMRWWMGRSSNIAAIALISGIRRGIGSVDVVGV